MNFSATEPAVSPVGRLGHRVPLLHGAPLLASPAEVKPAYRFKSERQFRLLRILRLLQILDGPAGIGGDRSAARARKTPLHALRLAGVLADHDLRGPPRPVGAREEYAVFEIDLVVAGLERPNVAVGQHQHYPARV